MSDPVEEFDRELRQILRDMYDIGDSDAETLLEVVSACMKNPGTLATAITTGATGAAIGGTVSVGTLALPSWFVFAAAGYLGGTAHCTIHNFTAAKAVDSFLRSMSMNKSRLKIDVDRSIRMSTHKKATRTSKAQRYRDFQFLDWSKIA